MSSNLIFFGRTGCSACGELRKELVSHAIRHTYICLDPPNLDYAIDDPVSVEQYRRIGEGYATLAAYGLMDTRGLPILIEVFGDIYDDPDAVPGKDVWNEPGYNPRQFRVIPVLGADGRVTIENVKEQQR